MRRRVFPIVGMYLCYFGCVGVLLPFLPLYLEKQRLEAWQIGFIQSIGPIATILTPPLWGYWADVKGRPETLVRFIGMGTGCGLLVLLYGQSFWVLLFAWAVYSAFAASMTPLLDSMAVEHVRQFGGSFSRLRLFGSLGFLATSSLFGVCAVAGSLATLKVPLVLVAAYTLLSLWVGSPPAHRASAIPSGMRLPLWKNRAVLILLTASALHWVASAPYHGMFALHITRLGLPQSVVGVSASLAVLAEVIVMFLYPRFAHRFSAKAMLMVSFACSSVRWIGLALATNAATIIGLNLLHGMTFGLFYVAAMNFLTRWLDSSERAYGQAWYTSIVYGVGGLLGYAASGWIFHEWGGSTLFQCASVVEGLPILVTLALPTDSNTPSEIPKKL